MTSSYNSKRDIQRKLIEAKNYGDWPNISYKKRLTEELNLKNKVLHVYIYFNVQSDMHISR